jgi:hypothetical protein
MKRSRTVFSIMLLGTALTACEREEPVVETGVTDEPAVEGLTPDEIRRQAEPMSPEEAEQLGIVDTTIHVEQLATPEDSLLLRDTTPPPVPPEP